MRPRARRRCCSSNSPKNTPTVASKLEAYPNSSLYKDKEELEALQLGSVQLLGASISKFGPLGVKEFDVFDLPFLMTWTTPTPGR